MKGQLILKSQLFKFSFLIKTFINNATHTYANIILFVYTLNTLTNNKANISQILALIISQI